MTCPSEKTLLLIADIWMPPSLCLQLTFHFVRNPHWNTEFVLIVLVTRSNTFNKEIWRLHIVLCNSTLSKSVLCCNRVKTWNEMIFFTVNQLSTRGKRKRFVWYRYVDYSCFIERFIKIWKSVTCSWAFCGHDICNLISDFRDFRKV